MASKMTLGNRKTHGLIPPDADVLKNRRDAARYILAATGEGVYDSYLEIVRAAVDLWRTVIVHVMHQKSPEWFLTSAMLGHPTPLAARQLAVELGRLSEAIVFNAESQAQTRLQAFAQTTLPNRLRRFLSCTADKNRIPYEVEGNWLYLLRADEEWGVVNLGTIEGNLEQALVEMDDLNPELAPYGISGAWRVKDIDAGYGIATRVLRRAFIQPDFYEFDHLREVDQMKVKIAIALADGGQLVENVANYSTDFVYVPRGERRKLREAEAAAILTDEEDASPFRP